MAAMFEAMGIALPVRTTAHGWQLLIFGELQGSSSTPAMAAAGVGLKEVSSITQRKHV